MIGARASDARFQLAPPDVLSELRSIWEEGDVAAQPHGARFQLTVRRHKETMNSTGVELEATRKLYPTNPVYMHPDDLATLGLVTSDAVIVSRGAAAIGGRAKADETLRRGVVAMSYGWSGRADHPWEATNVLVDADQGAQPINHMPIMTGIPVDVTPAPTSQTRNLREPQRDRAQKAIER